MTRARKSLIDLSATPYYHLIARCVRRAFLCGDDKYSGKNFDHRREWLVKRMKLLSDVFAIDIAAYAIMSNHYHVVVKVNKNKALDWSVEEVIRRWYKLYKQGDSLVERFLNGEKLNEASLYIFSEIIATWRARLYDISWYMKNLNEYIARQANKEDNCTGKYWEGRYKSQALLDDKAILSCMAYVDLNPIRAKIATELENSDFTSIQERIHKYKNTPKNSKQPAQKSELFEHKSQPMQLLKLGSNAEPDTIPFRLIDYLELVSWSSRYFTCNKQREVSKNVPNILAQLNIEEGEWLNALQYFRRQYANFAGSKVRLMNLAAQNQAKWYKGVG